jgi:hypothetical protein
MWNFTENRNRTNDMETVDSSQERQTGSCRSWIHKTCLDVAAVKKLIANFTGMKFLLT